MTPKEQRESPSLSVEIVRAVAEQTEVEPAALPPLYEYIDPDALNVLFTPTPTADRQTGSVEFSYAEHRITVSFNPDRTITVTAQDAHAGAEPLSITTGSQSSSLTESVDHYSD